MNKEFLSALTDLCKEKGISEDIIIDALEAALLAAYKRNFASAQNVDIKIDKTTGSVQVYMKKEVVEEIGDLDTQYYISLEEARKISGAYIIGDTVYIEVTPSQISEE